MSKKIIDEINNIDNGNEHEPFEIEVECKGNTTFVDGIITRCYRGTVGGSYLGWQEKIYECISRYVEIITVETLNSDMEFIEPVIKAKELETILNERS
jgi:hypothetical protein